MSLLLNFDVGSRIELFASSFYRSRQLAVTTFDQDLATLDCSTNGNYSMIVHGWWESIKTPWVMDMVEKLASHRGGCILFMDYSNYSYVPEYLRLSAQFRSISNVLLKKVRQVGNYERLFMFGFSFGARLCFEVGAKIGNQTIDRIDACDPAGPGFDYLRRSVDPKNSAKFVSCINTSIDKGTRVYNCHQNFRMGWCGYRQPAASFPPLGNHGLCPYFYNAAFEVNFEPSNEYGCWSNRTAPDMPSGLIMGFRNPITS